MKRRYINAEKLVPRHKKKYDRALAESELIRFWGLKCCPLLENDPTVHYDSSDISKEAERGYKRTLLEWFRAF